MKESSADDSRPFLYLVIFSSACSLFSRVSLFWFYPVCSRFSSCLVLLWSVVLFFIARGELWKAGGGKRGCRGGVVANLGGMC